MNIFTNLFGRGRLNTINARLDAIDHLAQRDHQGQTVIVSSLNSRISDLESQMTSVNDLALSINTAVDRIDCDVASLNDAAGPAGELTISALETEARLAKVEDVARSAACDIDSINTKVDSEVTQLDARLGTLNDATTEAVKLAFSQINELRAALNHNTRWVAERFGVEVAPVPWLGPWSSSRLTNSTRPAL